MDDHVINLDELHAKLLTPESVKQDFAQFRLRILNKAQADLRNTLIFEWEPIKKGGLLIKFVLFSIKRRFLQKERLLKPPKKKKYQNRQMLNLL